MIQKVILKWVWLLILLSTGLVGHAQVTTVRGTVYDESGIEVIGANVKLKDSSTGVITDLDGVFKLDVPDSGKAVLIISFIGYQTQEVALKGRKEVKVTLVEIANELSEVTVVAYGVQKKETLTGAISSVKNEALLRSPNASVANALAGQITGLSSVTTSGQPGAEDPTIYVRGVGSLTEGGSQPLVLVDGVERSFFQMDPNEIESISVLKDASATAVFGVRGANGVVLVTTKRGVEGKAKISLSSSFGLTQPTRLLEMADSYTYALCHNEMKDNDGKAHSFDDYVLERFRLNDEPIMYPNMNWRDYLLKKTSIQTQHNLNISGGTEKVRYFISLGFLYQNGLFRQFEDLDYKSNYTYSRYNYLSNLDLNLTKSTILKLGLGGIVGLTHEPKGAGFGNGSQPFCSPGIIDGKLVVMNPQKYEGVLMNNNVLKGFYDLGYKNKTANTMNMDLSLVQKLDVITKGLSVEIKGAYNTSYSYSKNRTRSQTIRYEPHYQSELEGYQPEADHPLTDDPNYNKNVVYRVLNDYATPFLTFDEETTRGRNWYLEASLRYNRKFGDHNVGGLLLYNQSKKYYPKQYTDVPAAYVGLVGRLTYDYKSRYMAEFNFGYNGSENFAPDKRFGAFPAGSIGYIISEEPFMKKQKVVDYLKLRASIGLVGNDNMNDNRFLYLSDAYLVDQQGNQTAWKGYPHGYNFGYNSTYWTPAALESRLGNRNVTWETALKQNYGIDVHFLKSRLKITADVFFEDRKDILISRGTIPMISSLTSSVLPVVNMGRVKNHGYEIEVKWEDMVQDVRYWANANVSYSKNKIIEQDEVEPNEPYLWRTGKSVGAIFGYVAEGFYSEADFKEDGKLIDGLPDPKVPVYPGDVKYKDLNGDHVIDTDDQCEIGYPTRPAYTFGLNYGLNYKGWFLTMNWLGVTDRSLVLANEFRTAFGNGGGQSLGLFSYHVDERWTPETAETATMPRLSENSGAHNAKQSSLWVKDGSYLRLKSLTIGYEFADKKLLKKIGISKFGIKLSGYNLLTFDKFGIMDPECKPNNQDTYPITKTYNLGVNITF